MQTIPLHTPTTPYLAAKADWLASVLDLFPRCANCGKKILAGEAVTASAERNRVEHVTPCQPTAQ